jgi:hypothetical protein
MIGDTEIIRRETKTDEYAEYTYELISTCSGDTSSYGISLYSITVKMKIGEKCYSGDSGRLFADGEKAMRFFDKLVNGLATPANLTYIIEDEFYAI